MRYNTSHILTRFSKWSCFTLALLIALTFNTLTVAAQGLQEQTTYAKATLQHTPYGNANIQWDAQNTALTVTISLTGLQPQSIHPAHIHAGDCSVDGPILYNLHDIIADAGGNSVSVTTIRNFHGGIPQTGWYINVHTGPTINTPAEELPISCGTVNNPDNSTFVNVPLDGTKASNQMANGTSELTIEQGQLKVTTTVYNLVPGSSHAAHIHLGTCKNQVPGNILYTLTTLTANAQGNATTTTFIPDVQTIPTNGWYINIHNGTDLSTQSGFDPIACGDVVM